MTIQELSTLIFEIQVRRLTVLLPFHYEAEIERSLYNRNYDTRVRRDLRLLSLRKTEMDSQTMQ